MKYLIIISCVLVLNTAGLKIGNKESYLRNEDEGTAMEEDPPIYDLKEAPKLFEKFIKDYNKKYEDDEDYNKHYKNFVSNLEYINEVNSQGRSYSVDITMFTDDDESELEVFTGGFDE